MPRDNFSTNTTRILAERVGYLCSNPKCRVHTVGPNNNSEKSTKIGEAAHISAASEGGPRYDTNLKPGQRSNIDNGIWLCSNCSDLIDKDFKNYPVALLKKWKADAELEMYEKINGDNKVTAVSIAIEDVSPFLEADLRYNSSGRRNDGYSDKNPTEVDEFGNDVFVINFSNKPIIHWKLDWEFSFILYNNSTHPAFNVQIKPLTEVKFSQFEKLSKINHLKPMEKIELSAEYITYIESSHIEADALLAKRIPEEINGLELEIKYLDEHRKEHTTIVSIKDQDIINTKL